MHVNTHSNDLLPKLKSHQKAFILLCIRSLVISPQKYRVQIWLEQQKRMSLKN